MIHSRTKNIVVCLASLAIGVAAGRWSASFRKEAHPPPRTGNAVLAQGSPKESSTEHTSFQVALDKADLHGKSVTLATILSSSEVSSFPKFWELAQDDNDEIARELVLDAWPRRDLIGFLTRKSHTAELALTLQPIFADASSIRLHFFHCKLRLSSPFSTEFHVPFSPLPP